MKFSTRSKTSVLVLSLTLALTACQDAEIAQQAVAQQAAGQKPSDSVRPAPAAASSALNAQATKQWVWFRGVNLAGADFGSTVLPGILGVHYTYPNKQEVDYFAGKGMNIIRFPVLWERLQRSLYGSLDAAEIQRVDLFVKQVTDRGLQVILDPHNYARYRGQLIGSQAVPHAAFANFWWRLADRYKGNPKVIFGLMNEPHDMPMQQWVDAANNAVAAIRAARAANLILVPGNRWSGAWTWNQADSFGESNAQALLKIKDPYNWMWFEAHQYIDRYGSGTEDACVSGTIGSERLKPFTDWLRANGKKGFLGEFASGDNAQCDRALNDMVAYMENNGDVLRGWTYWAAGPWWQPGTSLEPNNGKDARQMPILRRYLP
jgi:endoglucanase